MSNAVRPCMSGTPGADLVPTLASIVDPKTDLSFVKSDYSAFVDTSLLIQLRTRLITHVYVCGTLSNISVYATVLDAVRHGIQVTLVEDCLGFINPKCTDEAVRHMADNMGASGIDHQELMDDLCGLLGDVIREEDFKSRFQVSMAPTIGPPGRSRVPPSQRNQLVEDWIANAASKRRHPAVEDQGRPSNSAMQPAASSNESQPGDKTSRLSSGKATPESSPPRKRSTSDLEEAEEGFLPVPLPRSSSRRETPSPESSRRGQPHKPRLRNTRSSQESTTRPVPSIKSMQSKSTGDIPDNGPNMLSDSGSDGASGASARPKAPTSAPQQQKKRMKKTQDVLCPPEVSGEGDCRLICDVVSPLEGDGFFYLLKENVQWQKMYHRSGEVPRLVAVQGEIINNGTEIPIYRHPADESPELNPFDSTVSALRLIAERHVGHPLNHVLIQWYRSGEDNISEHSDKTLDIVRGSNIVNMSFGAQRTMTLRSKKQHCLTHATESLASTQRQTPTPIHQSISTDTQPQPQPRMTQRIPLPHSSLFILGPLTNTSYLHSIRADKRPFSEKLPAETAFDCERISLTFRHIGTFVNIEEDTIWGQGATSKQREERHRVVRGRDARIKGEGMIRAFGKENHTGREWIWEEVYGGGWDVVDFEGHEGEAQSQRSMEDKSMDEDASGIGTGGGKTVDIDNCEAESQVCTGVAAGAELEAEDGVEDKTERDYQEVR